MNAPSTYFEKVWKDHVIDDVGETKRRCILTPLIRLESSRFGS